LRGNECFGGGSNSGVLRKSLGALTTPGNSTKLENYRSKRYLGLSWSIPSPFIVQPFYTSTEFDRAGVYIKSVNPASPFYGTLSTGDLLLGAKINDTTIVFGECDDQQTPGVLIYYGESSSAPLVITIDYIKKGQTKKMQKSITLNKLYQNVSPIYDRPLQSGFSTRVKNKISIIKY